MTTPATCEVVTVEATTVGKLDSIEFEACVIPNGTVGVVVDVQAIDDSRAEEDNGEASDETSSRRESNSSADGSDHFPVQQTNNEDQDTTTNLQDTTQNTPRKKKKKRRSRRKSRSHSRTNSLQNITTPNPTETTEQEPTVETNTPQHDTQTPNTDNETITATPNQDAPQDEVTTNGTTNEDTPLTLQASHELITKEEPTNATTPKDPIKDSTTDSTTDDGTTAGDTTDEGTKDGGTEDGATDKGTTQTITDESTTADNKPTIDTSMTDTTTTTNNKPDTTTNPDSTPSSPSSSSNNLLRSSSSSSTTTTTHDNAHILLDLTPPPTRGRSNAFYGTKGPPPLVHSHSDGAAIAQHNTSASISPRRNTVGLGVTVTPTIPEPASSGLSKPKIFTWRSFNTQPLEKGVLAHSRRFLVGFAETIGRRPSMEDCMVVHGNFRGHGHEDYFALFDGHGGKDAAAFAAEHLHQVLAEKLKTNNVVKSLKEAFADTNRMITEQKIVGGTTAVVALFIGKKGFIANVGDTRAVLCRDGVPLRVSLDHKPELPAETSRIKQLGGTVTTTYNSAGHATSRVNGMLSVSRALGDTPLHPYVSSDPEIHGPLNLESEARNQFVVLACDGVWDVLTDEEATSIVAPIANPEIASRRLRDEAFARGSTDNISVMVIRCPPFIPCD